MPLNASEKIKSSAKDSFSKEKKVMLTNISGAAFITAWGISNWDYFKKRPAADNEGWFTENTKEGGADKFGHFYISWSLSHIFSGTYSSWGYSEKKGAKLGALSSWGIMSWMEIGDSFSSYGFSYEDFLMNTAGCAFAYIAETRPRIKEKIDFRVEYTPGFKNQDIFTDYENLKYLMALKLDGFRLTNIKYLKYIELHIGYYARGYSDSSKKNTRHTFVGAGINVPKVLKNFSLPGLAQTAHFIQIPGTRLSKNKKLN